VRRILLVLCFIFVGVSALSFPRHRAKAVSGQVIAYSGFPGCLNGNGYWSMVIRVQTPKDISSTFVRVEFSLPCDKSAGSILVNPSTQKFHLFRQQECDEVLKERWDIKKESKDGETGQDPEFPLWTYLPGNERFTLPFGQVLPCYYSAELPLVPVL